MCCDNVFQVKDFFKHLKEVSPNTNLKIKNNKLGFEGIMDGEKRRNVEFFRKDIIGNPVLITGMNIPSG